MKYIQTQSTTDSFPIYIPNISEKSHNASFITIYFDFINLFRKNAEVEFKYLFFKLLTFSEDTLKKKMPKTKDDKQIQSRNSNTTSDWLKNLKGFHIKQKLAKLHLEMDWCVQIQKKFKKCQKKKKKKKYSQNNA